MKIFVATLLVLICPLAYARFLPEWSYEKLNSEADLIVIATPVKILETTEYEPYRFDIFDKPDPVKANVTKTDFSILTILQGTDVHMVMDLAFQFRQVAIEVFSKILNIDSLQSTIVTLDHKVEGDVEVLVSPEWNAIVQGRWSTSEYSEASLFCLSYLVIKR